MYLSNQKEAFNAAYVNSMAAHAGLKTTSTVIDDDSVDVYLIGSGYPGLLKNPQLHLQLKCTASPAMSGDVLKFPLKMKNYNDLRAKNVIAPQYLVVMVVPTEVDHWIAHEAESMRLQNCCYWVSLRGKPAVDNKETVTVDVPLAQRLTTKELSDMALRASRRKWD